MLKPFYRTVECKWDGPYAAHCLIYIVFGLLDATVATNIKIMRPFKKLFDSVCFDAETNCKIKACKNHIRYFLNIEVDNCSKVVK